MLLAGYVTAVTMLPPIFPVQAITSKWPPQLQRAQSVRSELCRPSERPLLVGEVVPTFADRGVTWSAQRIPPVVFSVFLTGATIISSK
jgi:hypothetical protein